jgi:hypothetical protein
MAQFCRLCSWPRRAFGHFARIKLNLTFRIYAAFYHNAFCACQADLR